MASRRSATVVPGAVAPGTGDDGGQRARILALALQLMAEHGVHAMSMRRLADACGLNVATLYHYFPSKADLLAEVIASRSYEELLAEPPPIDPSLGLEERLGALLAWIWEEMGSQEDVWRLLLGESLRGEEQAMVSAAGLSATFERALDEWLGALFPDLAGDRAATARVLRGTLQGFFSETLPLSHGDRVKYLRKRAAEVAAVVVGPQG